MASTQLLSKAETKTHCKGEKASVMVPEQVSLKRVSRFYCLRHHLLHKAKKSDIEKVVNDVCGSHAQATLTPYVSLWNRVERFERNMLDEALYKVKTLVKIWCMRGTLHIIPSNDLAIYNKALKNMWFEHHGRFMKAPDWPAIEERKNVVYPKILEALSGKPLKRKELNAKVRSLLRDESKPYERLFSAWGGILKETCYEGLTVHAQPCDAEACFVRLDKWLPNLKLDTLDEKQAKEELFLKYLGSYGPASVQDFASWSGLMVSDARKTLEDIASKLEEVKIENVKGQFWMEKKDYRALMEIDLDEKTPAHLLPKFDSFVLGHKDRIRIIQKEFMKQVFRPAGDIAASILVNDNIVGTWRYEKTKNSVTVSISPFQKLEKEDLNEIKSVADDFGRFLGVAQTVMNDKPCACT
jgi:hypothetical protein